MKILRLFAIVSFLAGLSLLVAGFVTSRDDGDGPRLADAPPEFTSTPTPRPSVSPTIADTPTPTATPYDGALARFKIPRFNVDAEVEAIGLLPTNVLDTPHNPHNVGWYDIYDKPGFGGNAVFSAHFDYWPDIRGPFYRLRNVEAGDEIVLTMDDGREYTYRVISYKRYPVDSIPMGDLIDAAEKPDDVEWITMITCGGAFQQLSDEGWGDYLERDVVVAERVS
ncbi:MAG: class F sortase [Dehalococcoidia bacterium]|nr:class F sortase [Dehalococcoidia bacterium]